MGIEYDLAGKIIGCAMKVHRVPGPGYLESVYQKSLMIEMGIASLGAVEQQAIAVHYEGQVVGDFIADILVEAGVIVEIKAVRALSRAHEIQLVNYLTATRKDIGVLVNFGGSSLEYRKKFRTQSNPTPIPKYCKIL